MPSDTTPFVRRVLTVVGIVALSTLLIAGAILLFDVLLLVFAGILLAILLDGLACALARRTLLTRGWSLALVGVVLVGLLVAAGAWIGPGIAAQVDVLGEALRQGYSQFRDSILASPRLAPLAESLPDLGEMDSEVGRVVEYIPTVLSLVLGALTTTLVILIAGVYFASDPDTYLRGAVALVPERQRARAREVFHAIGQALRKWLQGQFVIMVFVGVTVTVGLLLLGVPLAFTLGLLAFAFEFIPIIGPIIAAVPAVLIAFIAGPHTALYVAILFLVVQQFESYVLAPLVQKRAVALPPVMLILSQVLLGSVSGLLGIVLATPLMVVGIVLVQMLYVESVLDTEIEVLGENPDKKGLAEADTAFVVEPQPTTPPATDR